MWTDPRCPAFGLVDGFDVIRAFVLECHCPLPQRQGRAHAFGLGVRYPFCQLLVIPEYAHALWPSHGRKVDARPVTELGK